MKIVTLEEHVLDPGLMPAAGAAIKEDSPWYGYAMTPDLPYLPAPELYADTDEKRIADMDANGIDLQVLSCPAEVGRLDAEQAVPLARACNDRLAAAAARHPDRFAAFAVLPWQDPRAAVEELERVMELPGVVGVLVAGRPAKGSVMLDDERFDPVFAAAERLKAPIYIHPGAPVQSVQDAYYAGLDDRVSARLSLFGWGWHLEAGMQVLRMMLAGVFDRHPGLRVISGHWGEFVPYYLYRLDQALPRACTGLGRSLTQTYAEQVYVTPSGIDSYQSLAFCKDVLGTDRILFSVDFPMIGNEGARDWLEKAPVADADREAIAWRNAAELLGLSL